MTTRTFFTHMNVPTAILLAFAGLILICVPKASAQNFGQQGIMPDQVVVKLTSTVGRSPQLSFWDRQEGKEVLRQIGATAIQPLFPTHLPPTSDSLIDLSSIYLIHLNSDSDPVTVASTLHKMPQVEYAEPKVIHQVMYVPNDPYPDTTDGSSPWYFAAVRAFEAWDISRGDSGITIAVVDAGMSKHEDLYGNIQFNLADPIDGLDNDGDGFVDNYEGWDFNGATPSSGPDNDPFLGDVHGLHVAGVSSSIPDNGKGTAGMGFHCRLLPLKATSDDLPLLILSGYEGIVYAVDHGADIVNCSWGSQQRSRLGEDIINYATINKQAAVIAAAGNSQGEGAFYPAAYDRVVSVAGLTYEDQLFPGLAPNYAGSTYDLTVDVSAPGFEIASTTGTKGYRSIFGGTSFAAPIVAGGTGLVLAHFPDLTPFQAAQRVRVCTDFIDSVNAPQYHDRIGTGRANFYRALIDSLKPSIRLQSIRTLNQDAGLSLLPGDTIRIIPQWANWLHPSTSGLHLDAQLSILNTPFVSVLQEDLSPGVIGMNAHFEGTLITVVLSENIPEDYPITIRMVYSDSTVNYSDVEYLRFRVNPTWIDIDVNDIHTTLSSRGLIGFDDAPDNTRGQGYSLDSRPNRIYESGLLLASPTGAVSDHLRNQVNRDQDFRILEPLVIAPEDGRADLVVKGSFDDGAASSPIGVEISQELFGWDDPARRQFLIVQYIIDNPGQQPLPDLYASVFTDWDIISHTNDNLNVADYDAARRWAYTADVTGGDPNHYGVAVLSDEPFSTYAADVFGSFVMNNSGKFAATRSPLAPSTGRAGFPAGTDVFQFTNSGPFSIGPGDRDSFVVALIAGLPSDWPSIHEEAQKAWFCDVQENGPREEFLVANPGDNSEITFSDQNSDAISWTWDFGDGNTASSKDPTHTYTNPGTYVVRLQVSDGYCTSMISRKVQVSGSGTSSVSLPFSMELAIQPNPSSGRFEVHMSHVPQGPVELLIRDIQGRLLWQTQTQEASLAIDSHLAPGTYVLEAISGRNSAQKLIVIW